MNRGQLKADAKEAMRQSPANPYLCTILYLVVGMLFSILTMGSNVVDLLLKNNMIDEADPMVVVTILFSSLMSIFVYLLSAILGVGYNRFCLKVSRHDPTTAYGDLFSFFRYFFKVAGLFIVMNFFIFLWSLLLFIPGIIASFSYSQAYFILAEDPDKGIMECIRESKKMMAGYKMDYFILQLSFIGWILLTACTCGLAMIYVQPYMSVTMANFFNSLRNWNHQVVDSSYSVLE